MFTDDELPTSTEGRRKRNIIASPFTDDELPTFTDDELPMFTEGRKKISNIDVHYRWSTNFH